MNLSRSEIHALMKMVEQAVESNKQNNRPLDACQQNPAVNLLTVLYILQDAYMERVHNCVSHRV
jgi:hypothetical protein